MPADDALIQRCREAVELVDHTYLLTRRRLAERKLEHVNEILAKFDEFLDHAEERFAAGDFSGGEQWLMAAKQAARRLLGVQDAEEQQRIGEFLEESRKITDWMMANIEEAMRQVSLDESTRQRLKTLPPRQLEFPGTNQQIASRITAMELAVIVAIFFGLVSTVLILDRWL